MRVSTRLTVGYSLLILMFILCSVVAFRGLNQASQSMKDVVGYRLTKVTLVNDMGTTLRNMLVEIRNMALFSDQQAVENELIRFGEQKKINLQKRDALFSLIKAENSAEEIRLLDQVSGSEDAALSALNEAAGMAQRRQLEGFADFLTNKCVRHNKFLLAV
ncbi:MAG: hypothetical protein XXXJIFNMEKO3_01661 [Candidatus Erwinia impunctatus]|nr:hypothetical protein XXXJIFNMEKO_01661 [Culicoides impunctatus]